MASKSKRAVASFYCVYSQREAHRPSEAGVQLVFCEDMKVQIPAAEEDGRFQHGERLLQPGPAGHHRQPDRRRTRPAHRWTSAGNENTVNRSCVWAGTYNDKRERSTATQHTQTGLELQRQVRRRSLPKSRARKAVGSAHASRESPIRLPTRDWGWITPDGRQTGSTWTSGAQDQSETPWTIDCRAR